jgi:hypothetical protein
LVRLALAFVLLLGFGKSAQFLISVRLQRTGDEPVLRDRKFKLPFCLAGVYSGPRISSAKLNLPPNYPQITPSFSSFFFSFLLHISNRRQNISYTRLREKREKSEGRNSQAWNQSNERLDVTAPYTVQ